jgi:catechol 2,3-dioxygenase-like lactoylglutathione lyase family enzyme
MYRALREKLNPNSPTKRCSLTHLDELKNSDPRKLVPCTNSNWTLSDAIQANPIPREPPKISIRAFNHVSREVLSLEKSKEFYCDILGFHVIPRPPFDCDGYWLYGHGLNLHLVATTTPKQRQDLKVRRIQHFSYALPRVDHIAFVTEDIHSVKAVLDHYDVFYRHEKPTKTGIEQVFLFDPDGNVIEVSNCAPDVGETTCEKLELQDHEREAVSAVDNMPANADMVDHEYQHPARERFHSLGHLSQATDAEGDDEESSHVPVNTDDDDYLLGVAAIDDSTIVDNAMDRLSLARYSECICDH